MRARRNLLRARFPPPPLTHSESSGNSSSNGAVCFVGGVSRGAWRMSSAGAVGQRYPPPPAGRKGERLLSRSSVASTALAVAECTLNSGARVESARHGLDSSRGYVRQLRQRGGR